MIFHVYFHVVMLYGLIFWVTSFYSSNIFKLQNKMVRILVGARLRENQRKAVSYGNQTSSSIWIRMLGINRKH